MAPISYFHGTNKRHAYFEGWYFKHHGDGGTLACIPGMNVDAQGCRQAFLQILVGDRVYHISYPYEEFHASKEKLEVVVGKNYFSSEGMDLDIDNEGLRLSGSIAYTQFELLESDIMGPFRFVPFMQCNHGIESLYHDLAGEVVCDGKRISFDHGQGYCEKDWGSSFPKSYVWTQANDFVTEGKRQRSCVMVSVAHIPFGLFSFQGIICSILHEGTQYRLATYHGAKVLHYGRDALVISQGPYRLEVFPDTTVEQRTRKALHAPKQGAMSRFIHESPACTVRYRFLENRRLVFDMASTSAGFEYVEEDD